MRVATLDHLVLTVASIEATTVFYERLGMRTVRGCDVYEKIVG